MSYHRQKVEYFDPDDEYLNIFVSPSLAESFFGGRSFARITFCQKVSTTLISINSYSSLHEPESKWQCVENSNGNHQAVNNFTNKHFQRILHDKNVLTISCAINLFNEIQWRRPRWSAAHHNIFNYETALAIPLKLI